jgi:hypothetical protein
VSLHRDAAAVAAARGNGAHVEDLADLGKGVVLALGERVDAGLRHEVAVGDGRLLGAAVMPLRGV